MYDLPLVVVLLLGTAGGPAPAQVEATPAAAQMQQPVPIQVTDAWLGSDKFRHAGMSYAVTAFSYAAARGAGAGRDASLQVAVPVAAVAGIGKEIYDRRQGGIFSVRDLVADAVGIGAAVLLLREVR
jgi:uncharacterized protein YfiM (DUF2279 family)